MWLFVDPLRVEAAQGGPLSERTIAPGVTLSFAESGELVGVLVNGPALHALRE